MRSFLDTNGGRSFLPERPRSSSAPNSRMTKASRGLTECFRALSARTGQRTALLKSCNARAMLSLSQGAGGTSLSISTTLLLSLRTSAHRQTSAMYGDAQERADRRCLGVGCPHSHVRAPTSLNWRGPSTPARCPWMYLTWRTPNRRHHRLRHPRTHPRQMKRARVTCPWEVGDTSRDTRDTTVLAVCVRQCKTMRCVAACSALNACFARMVIFEQHCLCVCEIHIRCNQPVRCPHPHLRRLDVYCNSRNGIWYVKRPGCGNNGGSDPRQRSSCLICVAPRMCINGPREPAPTVAVECGWCVDEVPVPRAARQSLRRNKGALHPRKAIIHAAQFRRARILVRGDNGKTLVECICCVFEPHDGHTQHVDGVRVGVVLLVPVGQCGGKGVCLLQEALRHCNGIQWKGAGIEESEGSRAPHTHNSGVRCKPGVKLVQPRKAIMHRVVERVYLRRANMLHIHRWNA
eukprot:Opistho-2@92315